MQLLLRVPALLGTLNMFTSSRVGESVCQANHACPLQLCGGIIAHFRLLSLRVGIRRAIEARHLSCARRFSRVVTGVHLSIETIGTPNFPGFVNLGVSNGDDEIEIWEAHDYGLPGLRQSVVVASKRQ